MSQVEGSETEAEGSALPVASENLPVSGSVDAEVASEEATTGQIAPVDGIPDEAASPAVEPSQRRTACLLSVRRSLSWTSRQPAPQPGPSWLGAACKRLLVPYLHGEVDLTGLFSMLDELDAAEPDGRRRYLIRARKTIDAILGNERPRRRRDRRPRRDGSFEGKRASAPRVSEEVPASPRAPEAVAPAPKAVPPSSEGASGPPSRYASDDGPAGRNRRRRGRKSRPVIDEPSAPPESVIEVEVEPPPPVVEPRRPLGDPAGTGRMLSALGVFDDDELAALGDDGLTTIADLLLRAPVSQAKVARVHLPDLVFDEPAVIRATLLARYLRFTPHGRRWEVMIGDEGGPSLKVRWFRRPPRGWDKWEVGSELGFAGEIRDTEEGAVLYEGEPLGLSGRGSGLLLEYNVEGVDDARVRDGLSVALENIDETLLDWMPDAMVDEHRLLPLGEALRDAHFPANTTRRGRVRLAFDELFTIQVGVAWRSGRGKVEKGVPHKASHIGIGQIEAQHQIQLNDEQEFVFSEIRRDLVRAAPMMRLIQGDVGAGKSLVSQMAAIFVATGGAQVAMVAPDAMAAERRFLHADPLLRSIGIKTLLVADGKPDRAQVDAIRRGEAQVVYGTMGILDRALAWKRLGLVAVEERGPYGTLPSELLQRRGNRPDLLVTPRVPIPASLAFTVFGDFDVSVLGGVEHPPVGCSRHTPSERRVAYAALRETLARGGQGYVVFPVREGRDLLSVEDAVRMAKALQAEALPGVRLSVYSSEMSREERGRVHDDFQQRRIDVLVCTTHIEDSPPVANATSMVVEYADLHDVVRLHRLRAHVGQGFRSGTFTLVLSEQPDPSQLSRLDQLLLERDGFRLAELDLQFRGAEALLGERATEAPDFMWADPPEDRGLLLRARAAAFDVLERDPDLRDSAAIADTVNLRWGDWLGHALPRSTPKKRPEGNRRRRRRRK